MPSCRSTFRRELFAAAAALGIGSTTFQRSIAAVAAAQPNGAAITAEMVKNAEWVAGITLTDDERKAIAQRMSFTQNQLAALRKIDIGYDIPPAIHFNPVPEEGPSRARAARSW